MPRKSVPVFVPPVVVPKAPKHPNLLQKKISRPRALRSPRQGGTVYTGGTVSCVLGIFE